MKRFKEMKINALLTAIVYVLVGAVFILLPDEVLTYVPLALAILMALLGIIYVINYFRKWNIAYRSNGLAIGILLLFGALFLALQHDIILAAIPVLLGFAVVVSGAIKLQNAIVLHRSQDSLWIAVLVMAILSLVMGVLFIVNPFASSRVLIIVVGAGLLASGLTDLFVIMMMSRHAKEFKKAKPQEAAAPVTEAVQSESVPVAEEASQSEG